MTASPATERMAVPPRPLAHALEQLRRRRVHLVPADAGEDGTGPRRYPVAFPRAVLARLPGSPALRNGLAAAPAELGHVAGCAWLGADQRPRLTLEGLPGVWRLALPGRSGTYAELRELRTPRDLRPIGSRTVAAAAGVVERQHRIPLRYHPGAWLIIRVTARPSGAVRYDAWVWHAGRRRASALWWEETRRVIELFRDLAASWFWVGPPPIASGARTNGGSSGEAPDRSGGEADARA
jgi:hypothetical protein